MKGCQFSQLLPSLSALLVPVNEQILEIPLEQPMGGFKGY